VFEDPLAHGFQRDRRYCFFDLSLFRHRAGLAGLEQVIQPAQLHGLEILVTPRFQRLSDRLEVFFG